MLTIIGLTAALLFIGTLLLLAFRPEPPACRPPVTTQSDAQRRDTDERAGIDAPGTGASEKANPVASGGPPALNGPEAKDPERPPIDFRSHDIARLLVICLCTSSR